MIIHVVGGVYREFCTHPRWNEIYGSAGRAALAIATYGTSVKLHSYLDDEALQAMLDRSAWLENLEVLSSNIPKIVSFEYLHGLATPKIANLPKAPYSPIKLKEENIVRFGMLEGDAVVKANWAVYDPQNENNPQLFSSNGSSAKKLAIVLNSNEAARLVDMPNQHPSKTAPVLARNQDAEVIVVKMGPEGAFVWTANSTVQIPSFKTSHVWKIGSGDCFVAHFANAWMGSGKTPDEAAEIASKATAYYCQTQGFPTKDAIESLDFPKVCASKVYKSAKRPKVYLAGPFFDLAQIWMVQQALHNLQQMGLSVFSPYHDVGLGCARDVVCKDLDGIKESDIIFAITDGLDAGTIYEIGYARALGKPVVVYSERHKGESLKMMEGSDCIICSDYTSAIYRTLWEAVQL